MYLEKLFLGFAVDEMAENKLLSIDVPLRELFCGGGDYLQEWIDQDQKYLGKLIPGIIDLPALELLKSNILSLKQRILPDPSHLTTQLWLMAIIQKNS